MTCPNPKTRSPPIPNTRGPPHNTRGPAPDTRGPTHNTRGPTPNIRGPIPTTRGPGSIPTTRGPPPTTRGRMADGKCIAPSRAKFEVIDALWTCKFGRGIVFVTGPVDAIEGKRWQFPRALPSVQRDVGG